MVLGGSRKFSLICLRLCGELGACKLVGQGKGNRFMARRDRCKPPIDADSTALCRVKRLNGKPITKGTILAYDGAWQRKYVCEYVAYLGEQPNQSPWQQGEIYHTWAIGVRNLGEYYADGRVYRARGSKIKEFWHQMPIKDYNGKTVDTSSCYKGLFNGFHYHPVEPIELPEPLPLIPAKPAFEIQTQWKKDPKVEVSMSTILHQAQLSPEAVLEQFRIG